MNSTETYLNSPVKNCRTCVHCDKHSMGSEFDRCLLFQGYCDMVVKHGKCQNSRSWKPKPPRRSLRQWIYDLLLK